MRYLFILALLSPALMATAQLPATLTGLQEDSGFGCSFTIPDGWTGTRSPEGYLLVKGTEGVLIALMAKNYPDVSALRDDLASPTSGEGSHMAAQETPRLQPPDIWTVSQTGTLAGTEAKAIAMAKWNPQGATMNVVALAPAHLFSDELLIALRSVQASLTYIPAAAKAASVAGTSTGDRPDAYWTERLAGNSLLYMDSYSSPAAAPGDIGGGYSVTRRLDLCADGSFTTSGSSDHNFGGDGISAYGSGRSAGEGRWMATQDVLGRAMLRLAFHDGGQRSYLLENRNGLTYLNGEKWHRVNAERDGPDYAVNCP